MKQKSTTFMALCAMLISSFYASSQNSLYISTEGVDGLNNCQNVDSPCQTIAYALTQTTSGDTIKIAPGEYIQNATLTLNQSVTIIGSDPVERPIISSSTSDFFIVNSSNVTLKNLHFKMGLTNANGLRGIVSTQNYDNLKIDNNRFESTLTLSGSGQDNMIWTAFAISLESPIGVIQTVEITNNEITTDPNFKIFGRGIFLGSGAAKDAPGGIISGNTINAYYAIQSTRFNSEMRIENNSVTGMIMINYLYQNGSIILADNLISANSILTPDELYSLIELREIKFGSVRIENNVIRDYTRIGLLSCASRYVDVLNNTFTPNADATQFASVMVNTKIMTRGQQASPWTNEITFKGNIFNASQEDNAGTAIVFADHLGLFTPAFDNVIIGGEDAIEKNTFSPLLENYIVLDGQTGSSTDYPLWIGYSVTNMRAVTDTFYALVNQNNYQLAGLTTIGNKIVDQVDFPDLGLIILSFGGSDLYVSNSGSNLSNDCTDPLRPCQTIELANTFARENTNIYIAGGEYNLTETIALSYQGQSLLAWDNTVKPILKTNQRTFIDVQSENITIEGLQLELGLSNETGIYGIQSTNQVFNNLQINNNNIYSTSPVIPYAMVWNSFAIQLLSPENTNQIVTITNNVIGTKNGAANNLFGRGISLGSGTAWGIQGAIRNNSSKAFYALQVIQPTGNVAIQENQLNGITMVNAPLNGANIRMEYNIFDGARDNDTIDYYALLDLRAIETGSVLIAVNDFVNYDKIAALSMASKNVAFRWNHFTPSDTAEDFISLMVNTKLMTSGQQNTSYANEIEIKGNDFLAGGENRGTAIHFADHYGVNNAPFNNIIIGGPISSARNNFEPNLRQFIVLDEMSGPSTTHPLWANYSTTTMQPVSQNIEALIVNNDYNYNSTMEVEEKNIDSVDNQLLGKIILAYSFLETSSIKSSNLSVYPNPAAEAITLTIADGAAISTVTLIDLLGNEIKTLSFQSGKKIDVSDLPQGLYFIRLNNENHKTNIRFVKR